MDNSKISYPIGQGIELSIRCDSLISADMLSKSDPMVVVFDVSNQKNELNEIGRTESIKNEHNPTFLKKIYFDYFFQRRQKLRFVVIDIDNAHEENSPIDFKSSKHLGEVTVDVVNLIRSNETVLALHKLNSDAFVRKSTIFISTTFKNKSNNEIRLQFSGKDLKNKDFLGKSDPFLILYKVSQNSEQEEICRTEVHENNLNPIWRELSIDAGVFSKSILLIECRDYDSKTKSDIIGQVAVGIKDLQNNGKELELRNSKGLLTGKLLFRCKQLKMTNSNKKITKSDSQVLQKSKDSNAAQTQSKPAVQGSLNPKEPNLNPKINKSDSQGLKKCKEAVSYQNKTNAPSDGFQNCKDSNSGHKKTNPESKASQSKIKSNFCPSHIRNESYYDSCADDESNSEVSFQESEGSNCLMEYLRGGGEISLGVAIDFTSSNGDPLKPRSLHYSKSRDSCNEYMNAIYSIGNVLEPFDNDKKFPVFGFGAVLEDDNDPSHAFNVNLDPTNPCVKGVEGIIDSYLECLNCVELSEPTYFSHVINRFSKYVVSSMKRSNAYYVLLIITDGLITDMKATKNAIAKAAELPISIIIIGVGNCDFQKMEELDGDEEEICDSHGNKISRDIVQFVAMRDYDNDKIESLAEAVLQEIPDQMEEYMENTIDDN